MIERSITSINTNNTEGHTTLDDLKLKLAEHIITQYGGGTDVRSILTETKVGAWRRETLLKKLRTVFLAA